MRDVFSPRPALTRSDLVGSVADVPRKVSAEGALAHLLAYRPEGERFEVRVHGARCPVVAAGEGPSLLLVHGLGHDMSDWIEVFARRPSGMRLVAIDLPGFGLADTTDRGVTFAALVAAVKAAAQLCAGPPVVVGSSLGGHLAMLAALDGLPVAGLHLAAPGGLENVPTPVRAMASAYYGEHAILSRSDDDVVTAARALFGAPCHHAERIAARKLATHRSPLVRARARSVAEVVRQVFEQHVVGQTAALPRPVAVVWGDKDPLVPVRGLARFAEEPGVELVTLPGVGHIPMLEAPDAYCEHLFAFARRAFAHSSDRAPTRSEAPHVRR